MNGSIDLACITEKDIPRIMAFLTPREQYCVNLSECILRGGKNLTVSASQSQFWMVYNREDSSVLGVFMISPGLLLHCIRFPPCDENADYRLELEKLICPVLKNRVVQCIMGETEGTMFFRDIFREEPLQVIDYDLFGFDRKNVRIAAIHEDIRDLLLCHADRADAEALFPLQEAYEKEEVLPDESMFSSSQCMAGLRQTLLTRTVAVYRNGMTPVAKAAINAEGINWVQIGGVYTVPQWRSRGLARRLVQHIAELSAEREKGACLFVKKGNAAARNSYRNAGFTPFGEYRIVYYHP
ncbi:MAG: GNAT family N-acetyltransferase [Spirochaetaceae bacterium]|jgi:ribosomal protein S18 acetylase RimI-like enzyme|nr:GNAT family N-acetyltransferase [Spirochaetaceae bacterium]